MKEKIFLDSIFLLTKRSGIGDVSKATDDYAVHRPLGRSTNWLQSGRILWPCDQMKRFRVFKVSKWRKLTLIWWKIRSLSSPSAYFQSKLILLHPGFFWSYVNRGPYKERESASIEKLVCPSSNLTEPRKTGGKLSVDQGVTDAT